MIVTQLIWEYKWARRKLLIYCHIIHFIRHALILIHLQKFIFLST